jgi:hypothetical protein
MTKTDLPKGTIAVSLIRRRQMCNLRAVEAAAAELLKSLKGVDPNIFAQPGTSVFPKKLFVTDEGSPPLPDGQSLDYLELVQQQWTEVLVREQQASPSEFIAATIRMLQQAVIDARVLERRLIGRLEALE